MAVRVLRRALVWLRPSRRALVAGAEAVVTAMGFFGGLALVALGVAMVSTPAGVIVGGVELTTLTVLYARGRG